MKPSKFSVGDRVAVYGSWGDVIQRCRGKVAEVHTNGNVDVLFDNERPEKWNTFHIKQVRKLKPKPRAEVKKPGELWLRFDRLKQPEACSPEPLIKRHNDDEVIHVREILPNSITLTRESLVKGLHEAGILFFSAQRIDKLCKALGFEDSK